MTVPSPARVSEETTQEENLVADPRLEPISDPTDVELSGGNLVSETIEPPKTKKKGKKRSAVS